MFKEQSSEAVKTQDYPLSEGGTQKCFLRQHQGGRGTAGQASSIDQGKEKVSEQEPEKNIFRQTSHQTRKRGDQRHRSSKKIGGKKRGNCPQRGQVRDRPAPEKRN